MMKIKDLKSITNNDITIVQKQSDETILIASNNDLYDECEVLEIDAIDFREIIVYI